jgi:hypothetical protein
MPQEKNMTDTELLNGLISLLLDVIPRYINPAYVDNEKTALFKEFFGNGQVNHASPRTALEAAVRRHRASKTSPEPWHLQITTDNVLLSQITDKPYGKQI